MATQTDDLTAVNRFLHGIKLAECYTPGPDAATELDGQRWSWRMSNLLLEMLAARNQAMEEKRTGLDPELVVEFKRRYDNIIKAGGRENPPRPGRQRSKAANLVRRLEEHRAEVLRFIDDFRVPFTNNEIERDLRMTKLHEKISGGWRSMDGARAFLGIRSYLTTARKQDRGMLELLPQPLKAGPGCPGGGAPEPSGYSRSMRRNGRRRTQPRQASAASSRPADPTSNGHPRLPPNAIETLVALVTAGELDADLPLLYNTIGDRMQAIEAARLANALARLSIGDLVRVGHDVRSGYVHGLPATVVQSGTHTITIQLDHPVGKFANGRIRCSPLAVERIDT